MKVLVCGGRDYGDLMALFRTLDGLHAACSFSEVIEGGARGADTMAGQWARARGIELRIFPAEWQRYGRAAGFERNRRMLVEGRPEMVVAFAGGAGTRMMVGLARQAGVKVMEVAP
jgi:YspA, cpYpsA-related SLOG family